MKITQLMLTKGFGGAERYFLDLSLALADAGFEVQAVCHSRFQKRDLLARDPRIRLAAINVRSTWDPLAAFQITREVRAFGPDLVHAHLARGACIGGRIAHKLGIPCTVKIHNYVNLKYYRYVDHFITTTVDQQAYLIQHAIPPSRIAVIPNFSSMPPADRVRDRIPSDPVFVAVGRMVAKKGFDRLLDAFARYLASGHRGRLLLGGQGPELRALMERSKQLGIGDRVEFSGWIDDVKAFLARGDVFILPSLDEPFGIVVLEAMATGLPIITTRTQGPREILDDSTACFVPIGDSEALGNALQAAVTNPEATLAKASAALQRFRSQYARDVVIPRIVTLYQSLTRPAAIERT